jgi:molybdate transport system substrate-binding protein
VASFVYIHPAHGGTSGVHFAGVLRGLGIVDAVRDKALLWPGGSAAEAVVRGQAELVVHQISEILAVPGVTLVGPLPAALQKVTTYAAGLAARSAAPEPARSLIAYLARAELQAKLAVAGLDYRH